MNALLIVLVAGFSLVSAAEDKYYIVKGNINVDDILKSERLLQNYHNCLMDRGTCTPDGQQLKSRIPEIIESKCAKCSPQQKQSAAKAVKFLIAKKPMMWKELMNKYDPDGKLRKAAKMDPEVRKYGITARK